MQTKITDSFSLPCGAVLANRICKAATTERLSGRNYQPNKKLFTLYSQWADTDAGLLITGNIMLEKEHMESAGNVVLNSSSDLSLFKQWTESAKKNGNHIWAQLSHSGRQTSKFIRLRPKSASDIQLQKMGLFGKPIPMTDKDIKEVIENFTLSAKLARDSGFTGVQIHAAHGYLINQFLSPITNKRTDHWGGDIENRSRLLKNVIQEVRKAVGNSFPISVKLNSADFQRGGFTEKESLNVVKMLENESVDLLEISGGTYEKLAFFENDKSLIKESTLKREAYFLDFAAKVRNISNIPLMVTGGFRSGKFMVQALSNKELDIIGMARPFINDLEAVQKLLLGRDINFDSPVVKSSIKSLNDSAEGGYYARQILRLAKGKKVNVNYSASVSSLWLVFRELRKALMKKTGALYSLFF